jgi:flagellar hook-associated protein 3 FlgL
MAISFLSLMNMPRLAVADMQRQLSNAQVEVSTARHADTGLALGQRTGEAVALRARFDRNAALIDMNGLTKSELDLTQDALGQIADIARNFTATLVGARNAANGQQVVKDAARAALATFTALANSTYNGQNLFGGINTSVAPLADYLASPPTAGKTAVDVAFLAEFGMSQSAAGVGTITAAQMDIFLSGNFDTLFQPVTWEGTWSSAAAVDRNLRLDADLTMANPATLNSDSFRSIAAALTMALDLGMGGINQAAFEKIADRAAATASNAAEQLAGLQGQVGRVQQAVTEAAETLEQRNGVLSRRILVLEGADPYEAATRVNTLTTQLESSYALTARIARLSLLDYL